MVSVSFGTKNRKESPLCVLFSYLHSMSTMQPYISEPFIGDIWRIEVDELTDIVFTEVRNSADKQVSFSAINLSTGHVNFNALRLPERWLTGIEAAFDGVLLLHNYQSDAGPAHKGLIAVDAVTGETLWSNYTIGFDHLSVEGPIVYDAHIHPRKLFLADVKNGATKRIFEPSVYQELKNNILIFAAIFSLVSVSVHAKTPVDSIGVRNDDGKKVILFKVKPKDTYYSIGRRY